MPRFVVPIASLPRRRSPARSIATCQGMITCEVVELLHEHLGIDDAAGADHAVLAAEDPGRDVAHLVGLSVGDDRVPRVRPAVVAADEVGMLGEQVDDLALAFVSPLSAD